MADRPLLVFPFPSLVLPGMRRTGPDRLRLPVFGRQVARIDPQFEELELAMQQRALALQVSPIGVVPEEVLVLETVGTVDDFYRAVRQVEGLEWLTEWQAEELQPDEDFASLEDPGKPTSGLIFLLGTNQQAVSQIR